MLNDDFSISKLAIPASSALIIFLAYTSQYFFLHFKSVPLRKDEVWKLNIVTLCVWVCYFRSCYIDPGRLPPGRKAVSANPQEKVQPGGRQRWCRRCEAYKPPRAHHCKTCKRLISPWLNLEIIGLTSWSDAFRRWITIVPGHPIAFRISLSLTSFVSSSMLFSAWDTSRLCYGGVRLSSGTIALFPV